MKKFLLKLVGWQEQRSNTAEMIHGSDQKDQAKLKREMLEDKTRPNDEFVERTDPEKSILGPSESESKKV